jgi:acetolactate synthase-1/2/3 large subunit
LLVPMCRWWSLLATAKRHDLDLILVIYNNCAYGAEIRAAEDDGIDTDLALIEWPEFVPLAEALGGSSMTIRKMSDLELLVEAVATGPRPLVIEVKLNPFAPAGP